MKATARFASRLAVTYILEERIVVMRAGSKRAGDASLVLSKTSAAE